jgi:hypothetical protein
MCYRHVHVNFTPYGALAMLSHQQRKISFIVRLILHRGTNGRPKLPAIALEDP